jgi:hypothetical protein
MVEIETFNSNEDLLLDYDYDDLYDLEMGSFEGSRPMVGLISGFESIITPSILDLETKVARELFKIQLTLNWKAWALHYRFFFPKWHFFTINDDFKPCDVSLIIILSCRPNTYSFDNIIKKKKGLTTYN